MGVSASAFTGRGASDNHTGGIHISIQVSAVGSSCAAHGAYVVVSMPGGDHGREQFADAFAGEFLVSGDELRRVTGELAPFDDLANPAVVVHVQGTSGWAPPRSGCGWHGSAPCFRSSRPITTHAATVRCAAGGTYTTAPTVYWP